MARSHSEEKNLFDTFNHLWYYTDPVLRKYGEIKSPKKAPKKSSLNDYNEMSADDKIFNSLYIEILIGSFQMRLYLSFMTAIWE